MFVNDVGQIYEDDYDRADYMNSDQVLVSIKEAFNLFPYAVDIKMVENYSDVFHVTYPNNDGVGEIYICGKGTTPGGRQGLKDEQRIQPKAKFLNFVYDKRNEGYKGIFLGVYFREGKTIFCTWKVTRSQASTPDTPISKQIKINSIAEAMKEGFVQYAKGGGEYACAFKPEFLYFYLRNSDWLHTGVVSELTDHNGQELMDDNENGDRFKLPQTVKDCAKTVIDYIYKIDNFERVINLFNVTDKEIKIDATHSIFPLKYNNWPRCIFVRSSHELYRMEDVEGQKRLFDTEFYIHYGDETLKCKLSNQWEDIKDPSDSKGHNNLQALFEIVNQYYSDFLEIKELDGNYYLYLRKKGFIFNNLPELFRTNFARRFITSLLAKPFVILTGNSGTGKTRIAKQFAEYLEVEDDNGDKNWLIVPVGADWTDNAKILGFYNPLAENGAGNYEKTGILKLIEAANVNPDKPFFIILDEMNLSHVERYFSDFLSHMETPDSPFKMDGYEEKELKYPDNLFIVGTVNIDETTYMFSPKVLDRANVVEFKPDKEDVLALFGTPVSTGKVTPANDGTAEAFLRLAREIRTGKCEIENVDAEAMDKIRTVFDGVYDVVEKKDFEFAFRTVREIRQYIAAAYEISGKDEGFNLNKAIDEQILQKIMPKIHGNRKEIGELLDKLEKICNDNGFALSVKKIKQMEGKLDSVQYASFI